MLVELRGLGMESQEVFSGVILVIGHLTRDGPEVAVDVEEVHVHGNLDAVPLEVLFLIDLVHDYHLTVCHGGNQLMVIYIGRFPVGHTEEIGDEYHENDHDGAQGNAQPQDRNITGREEDEHGADAPAGKDGPVRVVVDFNPLHNFFKIIKKIIIRYPHPKPLPSGEGLLH